MPTQNVSIKGLQASQTLEIQIPDMMSNWTPSEQNFSRGKNKLNVNSHFHRVHKKEMSRV